MTLSSKQSQKHIEIVFKFLVIAGLCVAYHTQQTHLLALWKFQGTQAHAAPQSSIASSTDSAVISIPSDPQPPGTTVVVSHTTVGEPQTPTEVTSPAAVPLTIEEQPKKPISKPKAGTSIKKPGKPTAKPKTSTGESKGKGISADMTVKESASHPQKFVVRVNLKNQNLQEQNVVSVRLLLPPEVTISEHRDFRPTDRENIIVYRLERFKGDSTQSCECLVQTTASKPCIVQAEIRLDSDEKILALEEQIPVR